MKLFNTKADLYERIIAEKDRQITILAEQIDYLHIQLGMAAANQKALNPSDQEAVQMGVQAWMSEEEEDVRDWLKRGLITEDQLPEVLDGLGISETEL